MGVDREARKPARARAWTICWGSRAQPCLRIPRLEARQSEASLVRSPDEPDASTRSRRRQRAGPCPVPAWWSWRAAHHWFLGGSLESM